MHDELRDRRVLVTGASSGIGRASARALLDVGARVAGVGRRRERLDSVPGMHARVVDLADPRDASAAVEFAVGQLGGLDALVNAAGVSFPGPIAATPYSSWKSMFDVNVLGLLAVTQAAIPHLRQSASGHVVNITSMSGHRILSAQNAVYGATKHAVQAISDGLRKELVADAIRVSAISPSYVKGTEIHRGGRDPEAIREAEQRAEEFGVDLDRVAGAILYVLAEPADVQIQQLDIVSSHPPDSPMRPS